MVKAKPLPVALRPHVEETLYSWLARISALYRMPIQDLLGPSIPINTVCLAPSESMLQVISELTLFPVENIEQLGLQASDALPPAWWEVWQFTPGPFDPRAVCNLHLTFKYCRSCLHADLLAGRDDTLRRAWLFSVPTICPEHGIPMDDRCRWCSSQGYPIMLKTGRGFRLICSFCHRPAAGAIGSMSALDRRAFRALAQFEQTLLSALRRAASEHPDLHSTNLVRAVEDLLWILTIPAQGGESKMFVHCLPRTVFQPAIFRMRLHGAHPRLANFPIQNRRWPLSHIAVMLSGSTLRGQLLIGPRKDYQTASALKTLSSFLDKHFGVAYYHGRGP